MSVLTVTLLGSGCGVDDASRESLVGAWRSSIRFESGAFASIQDLEFMYLFHADGTLTESSNYDAAPPVPPAYGIWRKVGRKEYEAKYEFFSTTPSDSAAFRNGAGWMPSGRGVLTERIQVSDDGNAFTSTIRYDALDRQGKAVEGGGAAVGRGSRTRL